MMSKDDSCFEKALLDLKKLLGMPPVLGLSSPMPTAYYDALRNKIDRRVILANKISQHVPAREYPIDVDGLKLLVEIRGLVLGLKREDVTTQNLDSTIHPGIF